MHVSGVFRKTEFSYDDFIINIYGNTIADKIYFLNDTVNQYVKYLSSNDVCFEIKPESSIVNIKSYDGELILTKVDTIKRILSGTFWFNILTDHCDTMKVTDGRFDIRYN